MASKPVYAVGVDAGSARTRTVICVLEDMRLRMLGAGEVASQGWARSRIADQNAVSVSIRESIREAELAAQVSDASLSVSSAVIGIGGTSVCGSNSRGGYDIGYPREIDQSDINRVVERAARVQLAEDRMILQYFPQEFVVDGNPGHRNPRGMTGSHLESYVHVITASAQEHQSLVGAANQAHFAVDETVFEAMGAAYAAVLPEDRHEGVAVIDIGAHSTDVVVYFDEALCYAGSLAICGDHFTRDVARGLYVTYEEAECLKEQHGCAILGLTADNSLIEVPSPQGRPPRETARRDLNTILEARAEELFLFVQRELQRISADQNLMSVVLCGGGARLAGMCEMAERILNCQARTGLPVGILDWPSPLSTSSWTTAAGLVMYSARLKLRAGVEKKGNGFFGFFR